MKVTVLIVDDNQSNLDTLHFLINDIEFEHGIEVEVIEATNGNDALNLSLKYDLALIILDIQMPVMDGFEVAKYLKKSSKTKDIPIAFLTAAFKSQDMREYGLHLGAYDYFFKPIDPIILVPKIKLYCNFYAITKELKDSNAILEQKVHDAVEKNSQMESRLHESEKLSAMGEMIGNIAHQWRQPLSVISTAATGILVQKEYGMLTDDFLCESMRIIDSTSQYLSKTIDDFRNFLKADTNEITKFNLSKEILKAVGIEEPIIKQNHIELILDLDDSIEIVSFPNMIIQCMINIINNAKDALKSKSADEERFIFISTSLIGDVVTIKIRDNGDGIDENIMKKIFEPYFTTKHQSQGTGLGLHMTYNIVKNALKGYINAQNTIFKYSNIEYKGAEFTISFPSTN